MNTLEAFNQLFFLAINGTPATPAWLIGAALLIADDVIYPIPLLLAGMWLWGTEAQRRLAIRACETHAALDLRSWDLVNEP
ncbi:hypothetical protein [Paraburkholderia sp. DGU8]|uniref:hypothetical protein n=1 Tax=Paraburkholderia sp. DGU8 TaxID=3161997 RepID=UPI0034655F08